MTTGGQDCLLFSHRFNERPTVVVNATFMFFVHSLSDAFVLVAASVSLEDVVEGGGSATAGMRVPWPAGPPRGPPPAAPHSKPHGMISTVR